jgi:branched-chain amino acid aminotransferase
MTNIKITLNKNLKSKPLDELSLGFGNLFTDHMFIMPYDKGEGWHDPQILPYGPLSIDPAAMVFHYAQEVFEGLKAYRTEDGRIMLFRPQENFNRLNRSNRRMCIPEIDVQTALDGLDELIKIEKDWVPKEKGTSLYIRPFIIATDAHLGVRAANQYLFIIILSPVGAYYAEGINPVKIMVESTYVRTVKGGTGEAKTGGNYASSLKAQDEAKHKDFTQVLWLDGVDRKYIEEVGTMNVFFKIDGEIITPALQGSILPGITRKSCIELLNSWGYKVTERRISIDEVVNASANGTLEEAFGTGTAAVISPIGEFCLDDKNIIVNKSKIGEVSQKLYDEITGIQWGNCEDKFGWTIEIK